MCSHSVTCPPRAVLHGKELPGLRGLERRATGCPSRATLSPHIRGQGRIAIQLKRPSPLYSCVGKKSEGPLRPRASRQQKAESDSDDDDVEEPLWRRGAKRSEIQALDFERLGQEEVEKEVQRLAKKQAAEKISNASYKELFQQEEEPESERMSIKEIVDKILVADFFLITLALIWFLTGVIQQSISTDSSMLDSWMKLWTPLFQPAIGVFMGAAAISAISARITQKK